MALNGVTKGEQIWNFLIARGLSKAGAAGLMGNLYAESGLRPNNLQNTYEISLGYTDESYTAAVDNGSYGNFAHDSAGYGLAQWTYWSRKQALLTCAKAAGKSIGDLETQLNFLVKEIRAYGAVFDCLQTTSSVRAASDIVLLQYERPADQGAAARAARAKYGQTFYDKYAGETSRKEEPKIAGKIRTATELAERAIDVASNYKTLYVMGCFGAPMTTANKRRYTANHEYNRKPSRTAMINAAGDDTFGFDCVCLIKGLLWGWAGDKRHVFGGAKYASNGVPDVAADQMIRLCRDVSTDFSVIDRGEAVWAPGHIGIYVGGGLAVESTPRWKNRVQITACNTDKPGYDRRNWKKHGKLPYITYTGRTGKPAEAKPAAIPTIQAKPSAAIKIGDIVNFTGNRHYISANTASGPACRPGKATVTRVYKPGKSQHPYHLVAVPGGGSNVYGWVNAADIDKISGCATPAKIYTVKRGDCLWGIAAEQLGNGSRWPEIKSLNGLASDIINAGQKLKLPEK